MPRKYYITGAYIRKRRELKGYSIKELATALDIEYASKVSAWEAGTYAPSDEMKQVNVSWVDTNNKPDRNEAAFEMMYDGGLTAGNRIKQILPNAFIKLGVYFDKEIDYDKPFRFYFRDQLIMEMCNK